MRKLFANSLVLFFAVLALTFASCGHGSDGHTHGDEAKGEQTEQPTSKPVDAKSGPEYTAHFICPMHCKGSGGEVAGKCPVCGMDYVANPNHTHGKTTGHEGHNHAKGEGHEGHDHGDGEGHEGHNH